MSAVSSFKKANMFYSDRQLIVAVLTNQSLFMYHSVYTNRENCFTFYIMRKTLYESRFIDSFITYIKLLLMGIRKINY